MFTAGDPSFRPSSVHPLGYVLNAITKKRSLVEVPMEGNMRISSSDLQDDINGINGDKKKAQVEQK